MKRIVLVKEEKWHYGEDGVYKDFIVKRCFEATIEDDGKIVKVEPIQSFVGGGLNMDMEEIELAYNILRKCGEL